MLLDLTAAELAAAFATGQVSPVDVIDALGERIAAVEPKINAFYVLDLDAARAAAGASEERWRSGAPHSPVDGIPVSVKENIATRGVPVPLGTAATELVPATTDAPPAARLREAGCVLFGKTTMPDFGMLSSGVSSFHGTTRNPWDLTRNPGGSSSGAAAAAASRLGPVHIGTDIGGSLRLPAGWTGLATLKPSLGRVPIDPPYAGRVAGPIARSVGDVALFMAVLSEPDVRDHMSLPTADIAWTDLDTDVRSWRVGYLPTAGCGLPVADEVAASVRRVADAFVAAGADVEEIAPFFTDQMLDDLELFWRVRAWVDFAAFPADRQARVLPYIADWARSGAGTSGDVLMRCVNRLMEIRATTVAATAAYDVVLSPVAPIPAFDVDLPSPTSVERPLQQIGFTAPYNISEQPAAAINCGFTRDGLPIGVQLAGRRFDDLTVLRAAYWWEQQRPRDAVPSWPE